MSRVFSIKIIGRNNSSDLKSKIRQSLNEIETDGYRDSEDKIDLVIRNNPALRKLPLMRSRDFTRFPNFLENVNSLQLENNSQIRDIDNINIFTNLQSLTLHDNTKNSMVCDFSILPNLSEISIKNYTVTIPDGVGEKTNLTELFLISCNLLEFSNEISNLTELETLYLMDTKVRLPDNINNLINLTTINLEVTHHDFASQDDNFHKVLQLPNLEVLNLTGQRDIVETLTFSEGDLPSLNFLSISKCLSVNNCLKSVHHLKKLIILDISRNSFYTLTFENPIPSLNVLKSSYNSSFEINPEFVTNLPNLKNLDLSHNILKELPENIGDLQHLLYLNLENNSELVTLPESISKLTNLTELILTGCDLILEDIEDVNTGIPQNPQEILAMFAPGCPLRLRIIKEINNNRNISKKFHELKLRTLNTTDRSPVTLYVSKDLRFDIIDDKVMNELEQLLNFLKETETINFIPDTTFTAADSVINGLFTIVPPDGGVVIDAGGPFRQFLSNINKILNEEEIFKVDASGELSTNVENKDKLRRLLGILILLFNSGEGLFNSSVKFGHCLNIYIELNGLDETISELKNEVKEFAKKALKENSENVNSLGDKDIRLRTYLWLMVEFVDDGFVVAEGSNCERVLQANLTKNYDGFYDYIFTDAPFRETYNFSNNEEISNYTNIDEFEPVWLRDYPSDDDDDNDPELLREHRRRLVNILKKKLEEDNMLNNSESPVFDEEMAKLNELLEVINSDRYFNLIFFNSGMINERINSVYNILKIGEDIPEDKPLRILTFLNDTIYLTINELTLLSDVSRDDYQTRYEEMDTMIVEGNLRGKYVIGTQRYDELKSRINFHFVTLFENYFYNLSDHYIDLTDIFGERELERRLPGFFEKIRRYQRLLQYVGEDESVYPFQIINLEKDLLNCERQLRGDADANIGRNNNVVGNNIVVERINAVDGNLRNQRAGGNALVNRYNTTQAEGYSVSPDIIEAIKYYYDRNKDDTSQFLLNRNLQYAKLNVFMLYNMLKPTDVIDITKLLSKINYYADVPHRKKEIFEDTLKDYKKDITDENIEELDKFIEENSPENKMRFDELFPDHNIFISKLLEFWTGSLKMSSDSYKVGYNETLYAFDAHTCFNELIMNKFDNKMEFLKMFIRSLMGVGTGFGVAGIKRSKVKVRNTLKGNNRKKRGRNKIRTRRNIKKKTQNAITNFIRRSKRKEEIKKSGIKTKKLK